MWQVDFPHNGPVTQKMCPFDDIIMGNNFEHFITFEHTLTPKILRCVQIYVKVLKKATENVLTGLSFDPCSYSAVTVTTVAITNVSIYM